jgi:hypothetical protein
MKIDHGGGKVPMAHRLPRSGFVLQTEIVATEKKKDSLPTIGHNVSPGARYILRGFSITPT